MKKQLKEVIITVFHYKRCYSRQICFCYRCAATHDKYVFLTDVDASISPTIITDLDASIKCADYF